ncbi:hypothetical protein MTR67_015602, partial [Solanum verrucosum]
MSTKMSCCNWKSGGDCDRCGDMISVQKCVTNFEGNEVSKASKMSNLTGGKSETNLPNQLEVIFCQDLNGSLDGVGSADVSDQDATALRELLFVHFVYFTDFEGVHLIIPCCNFVINFRKVLSAKVDREPSERQIEVLQWLCVNRTVINVEDVDNCE